MLSTRALSSRFLQLEITEDFLMTDRARAQGILNRLRGCGVRIAVDDYGTGYSSLAYLRELPIDDLKLDKSFITNMTTDARTLAIVRSTISLAHSLGLRLVAEGVEDESTSQELAASGCDVQQGWYHARALPPTVLADWFAQHRPQPYLTTPDASIDGLQHGGVPPARVPEQVREGSAENRL